MYKVTVNGIVYEAEKGTNLKDFFIKNNQIFLSRGS